MAPSQARPIGRDDLARAVRSVARHFNTDRVVIIGSQALLVGRADIQRSLRMSPEIDAYPENARDWEAGQIDGIEASEEINALFGEGSDFHRTHGFYIDGVDENTARLPRDWLDRAHTLKIDLEDNKTITAIAPEPADLIAAKLTRGEPKDVKFASLCLHQGLAKHADVKARLESILTADELAVAIRRLNQATHKQAAAAIGQGFGF